VIWWVHVCPFFNSTFIIQFSSFVRDVDIPSLFVGYTLVLNCSSKQFPVVLLRHPRPPMYLNHGSSSNSIFNTLDDINKTLKCIQHILPGGPLLRLLTHQLQPPLSPHDHLSVTQHDLWIDSTCPVTKTRTNERTNECVNKKSVEV